MPAAVIYGIKNCDTMKKAFAWLDKNGVAYSFHDYKRDGVDAAILDRAFDTFGWEDAINRKGTSWRKLPQDARDGMTASRARKVALENPSLIKRPLVVFGKKMLLGFDEDAYARFFRA